MTFILTNIGNHLNDLKETNKRSQATNIFSTQTAISLANYTSNRTRVRRNEAKFLHKSRAHKNFPKSPNLKIRNLIHTLSPT